MQGYPFYQEPLEVTPDDLAVVQTTLGDPANYVVHYGGEKKCGGFHPDYAVEWQVSGTAYLVLVCFGCGEMMVVNQFSDARYDMDPYAREQLRSILKPYRKNRPMHKSPHSILD